MRSRCSKHHFKRFIQYPRITSNPIIFKNVKILRPGNDACWHISAFYPAFKFFCRFIPVRNGYSSTIEMKCCLRLKSRYLMLKTGYIGKRAVRKHFFTIVILHFPYYPINAILIGMKSVKTEIETRDKVYYDAGTNTQSESKYIDNRIHFVTGYIAPCNFKIIFEHKILIMETFFGIKI